MTAAEQYIDRVVKRIPPGMPLRQQVALDLRALIAERLEHGQSIEQILLQLGDPERLAESYLSALPLVNATFWPRAAAKLVDWFIVWTVVGFPVIGLFLVLRLTSPAGQSDTWSLLGAFGLLICILALVLVMPAYFAITEYHWGQTIGKRLFNLRVVRESGGQISFGQSVVRQLPSLLQMWWIDVLFTLFTDKSQRAFEVLSKTRCVRVSST